MAKNIEIPVDNRMKKIYRLMDKHPNTLRWLKTRGNRDWGDVLFDEFIDDAPYVMMRNNREDVRVYIPISELSTLLVDKKGKKSG